MIQEWKWYEVGMIAKSQVIQEKQFSTSAMYDSQT